MDTVFTEVDPLIEFGEELQRLVTIAPKRPAKSPPVFHPAYSVHSDGFYEEHNLRITEYVHDSGLSVWSVSTNTYENEHSFTICFRTPVNDSTGAANVLQHAVLKGSQGYPVKSAFSNLLASSLKTYSYASTGFDRTCFNFASLNMKDFYNLFRVLMDLVFRPLAINDLFQLEEEGWRLQLVPKKNSGGEGKQIDCAETPANCDLIFNGVVYNEMKGAFSHLETAEAIYRTSYLFPNIRTYKEYAGGVPRQIPSVTLENLRDFHSKYYTLGNAYVVFYGPDDVRERLNHVHKFITENQKTINPNRPPVHIDTQIQLQKPLFVERPFASRAPELKDLMTMSWVLNPCKEEDNKPLCTSFLTADTRLVFIVLGYLLTGTKSSPLYKALAESGLGEAVYVPGVDFDLQHATYTVGLKGVKQDVTKSQFEDLILSELKKLAASGFEKSAVGAAVNVTEFHLKEFPRRSIPRGVMVARTMAQELNYYRYPVEPLLFEEAVRRLKQRLARGERVFQRLIKEFLVENNHRLTLRMKASSSYAAELEKEEAQDLNKIRGELGEQGLKEVAKRGKELQKRQETPATREELNLLPRLTRADIDPRGVEIRNQLATHLGVPFLLHDERSFGLVYADLVLSLSALKIEDIYYLPLLTRMMLEAGTTSLPAEEISTLIGRMTGGVNATFAFQEHPKIPLTIPQPYAARGVLMLSAKATVMQVSHMWCLLQHLLTATDFDNRAAGLRIIRKTISDTKKAFTGFAFYEAKTDAASSYSLSALMDEITTGYKSLFFHKQLLQEAEIDWKAVAERLSSIRERLLRRCNLLVNLTGDQSSIAAARGPKPLNQALRALVESLPQCTEKLPDDYIGTSLIRGWVATETVPQWLQDAQKLGLLLPAQKKAHLVSTPVSDLALAAPVIDPGEDYVGSALVCMSRLERSYLVNQIREQGGAFSALVRYLATGIVVFLTHRDPTPARSLLVFGRSPAYLEAWAKETLTQEGRDSILQAMLPIIGALDRPMSTEQKGHVALFRFILKEQPEHRRKFRDQVRRTNTKDISEFAAALKKALSGKDPKGEVPNGAVVLIGPEKAAKTLQELGLELEITEVD